MQSDPWQAWHFSHPFLTFFSSRHPKSILDRHCGREIKTLLLNWRATCHKSTSYTYTSHTSLSQGPKLQLTFKTFKFVPATPFDAALSFVIFRPVVVSEILHGKGILTQCLLILTVLTPDLVKVAHFEKKYVKWGQNYQMKNTKSKWDITAKSNQDF